MARSHCESSPVGPVVYLMNADSDGCQAFRPSQTTWVATVHIHHRHFIISVPESWYSFYRPTKGRRLSRPRHCSKEHRLSNKLFFIWLLTTPPHLKYVATLPCNWSLIACFLTWMCHKVVCQHRQGDTMWNDAGSCAWPISDDNNDFAANLPKNLSVKKMWKSVKIWQKYGHEFVASLFWPSL